MTIPAEIEALVEVTLTLIGAYLAATWICLIVWTVRDARARTGDVVVQILSGLLVLLFNLPGLILYIILRPAETVEEASLRRQRLAALADARAFHCGSCQAPVESSYAFCPRCRSPLLQPCPQCQRPVRRDWNGCPACGAAVHVAGSG